MWVMYAYDLYTIPTWTAECRSDALSRWSREGRCGSSSRPDLGQPTRVYYGPLVCKRSIMGYYLVLTGGNRRQTLGSVAPLGCSRAGRAIQRTGSSLVQSSRGSSLPRPHNLPTWARPDRSMIQFPPGHPRTVFACLPEARVARMHTRTDRGVPGRLPPNGCARVAQPKNRGDPLQRQQFITSYILFSPEERREEASTVHGVLGTGLGVCRPMPPGTRNCKPHARAVVTVHHPCPACSALRVQSKQPGPQQSPCTLEHGWIWKSRPFQRCWGPHVAGAGHRHFGQALKHSSTPRSYSCRHSPAMLASSCC